LLSSVPALDYREMREATWCCGGAGAYGIEHQGISRNILARKIGNARDTEATVVVTACPACITQLAFGARDTGAPVRVAHLSEVLATAYGVGLDAPLAESMAGATERGGQPA
jgi:glycolate oxidase iron-sulfur subunit